MLGKRGAYRERSTRGSPTDGIPQRGRDTDGRRERRTVERLLLEFRGLKIENLKIRDFKRSGKGKGVPCESISVISTVIWYKFVKFCVPKNPGRPWAGVGCADRAKGPGFSDLLLCEDFYRNARQQRRCLHIFATPEDEGNHYVAYWKYSFSTPTFFCSSH